MAEHRSEPQRPLLTQEELKKKFAVSNFDLNAILRGAQLTVVGGTFTNRRFPPSLLIVVTSSSSFAESTSLHVRAL